MNLGPEIRSACSVREDCTPNHLSSPYMCLTLPFSLFSLLLVFCLISWSSFHLSFLEIKTPSQTNVVCAPYVYIGRTMFGLLVSTLASHCLCSLCLHWPHNVLCIQLNNSYVCWWPHVRNHVSSYKKRKKLNETNTISFNHTHRK